MDCNTYIYAAKQNVMEIEKIVLIERTVHYHELHAEFQDGFKFGNAAGNEQFNDFFSLIAFLAKSKHELRYQRIGDSLVFVSDVTFHETDKIIYGKLRSIRTDVWPEIMDMETDIAKGIEGKETEGVVETTHFIINYTKKVKRIAIEYNQAGAKIVEFARYCELVGVNQGALKAMQYIPIAANKELPKFKQRMGKISNLYIRVHKDNLGVVKSMDNKMFTVLKDIKNHFTTEYIGLRLSFDWKNATKQDIQTNVTNMLTSLIADPKKGHQIEALEARAQDAANNYRMYTFDFLIDKLESKIKVQKKAKFKTIVSLDIFEKIEAEQKEKFKNT